MSGTIKWGILGLGKIAHKFASDLILIEDCELKAVASSSEDRAKTFANKYGLETFYGSYNDLYEDKSIDIIYLSLIHI